MSEPVALGVLANLPNGALPTSLSVFNFSLKIRQDLVKKNGKQNIPNSDIVKTVFSAVKSIWKKTEIPNLCDSDPKKAERKIDFVIKKGKQLKKTPVERRGQDFGSELRSLLDMSLCQHTNSVSCDCPAKNRVPAAGGPSCWTSGGPGCREHS